MSEERLVTLSDPQYLVLLSGGLDSTTLAYLLQPAEAISFDYGQRHRVELKHAKAIADYMGIKHTVIDVSALAEHWQSALTTSDFAVPEGHYTRDSLDLTIVPNRNLTLLSIAAGVAASRGIGAVAYAAHASDGPVYPDCTSQFVHLANATLQEAIGIKLIAPFIEMEKWQIIEAGAQWGVPFGMTYSCYNGGEVQCGVCSTCQQRKESFQKARVPDPTTYLVEEVPD